MVTKEEYLKKKLKEKGDENPRDLEKICDEEDFHIELEGNVYCGLSLTNSVGCRWQDSKKDKNGCYACLRYCNNLPEYE